jgi:uncharacterized protein
LRAAHRRNVSLVPAALQQVEKGGMTMAQPGNLQREPSMEEILASIRRIIEDSDTSRKTPDLAEAAPAPLEASNVHAFRLGLHESGQDAGQPPEPSPSRQEEHLDVASEYFDPASQQKEADDDEPGPSPQPASDADEIEMELSLSDFPEERGAQSKEDDASSERPSTLISDFAGRQVAASFGELSAAFDARSRKTFDEIAEEMMRPMLQDWLDNNLPHLVERLVREEIERIARGAAAPR